MLNILSMSLYGNSLMYLQGAVVNAKLMPTIYPGWKMVIYCECGIDTSELESLGVEIRRQGKSHQHSGMFWRFLAAWDENVEYVIFRDVDSRINVREAAAVQVWMKSRYVAHCMHDHIHHRCMPIFGGMWGIKANVLPVTVRKEILRRSCLIQKRVMDMCFLYRFVHPLIMNSTLRHSSQVLKWGYESFPNHPSYDGFVGQRFT